MLHAAVGAFLDTVTEREFDPTVLAVLTVQGFHDIHFIHGTFEFGKDVIAKRRHPETGVIEQYAIQSKAGDIGQGDWRAVRPQLEEAGYNTRAHPHFDGTIPRVAVLLTTGRLKGAAPTDAQEYAAAIHRRNEWRIEFWDREHLAAWLVSSPELALVSLDEQSELQRMLTDIRSDAVDEPSLERFTRRWIDAPKPGVASLEAAMLINAFQVRSRLDLAAMCALQLFRGACGTEQSETTDLQARSAKRLFQSIALELLEAVAPHLDDPAHLALGDPGPTGMVPYAVTLVRLTEILALAALSSDSTAIRGELERVVGVLATDHPGVARPISDQFAVSIIPTVLVLHRRDPATAAAYLRSVAKWLMDRTDPAFNGLGLGTMDDNPRSVVERLLGGVLEATTLSRSLSSYVLTVLLDICVALDEQDLYRDVLSDARALGITPCTTKVRSDAAETYQRAGGPVIPVPRLEYREDGSKSPDASRATELDAEAVLLLTAACRSRHDLAAVVSLAPADED
ncbi:restriction endonuclease [Microbacterium sp. K35]|uniref:restriction endonuclease n=1 Tax=Microbacterium sp. K35 TaxID=2305440 RepID=UPI0014448A46|nr:restriction endonuclease [Microbacterium sp. K35]